MSISQWTALAEWAAIPENKSAVLDEVRDSLETLAWWLVMDPLEYPSGNIRPTMHVRERQSVIELCRLIRLINKPGENS
jgi:hypothetical protein